MWHRHKRTLLAATSCVLASCLPLALTRTAGVCYPQAVPIQATLATQAHCTSCIKSATNQGSVWCLLCTVVCCIWWCVASTHAIKHNKHNVQNAATVEVTVGRTMEARANGVACTVFKQLQHSSAAPLHDMCAGGFCTCQPGTDCSRAAQKGAGRAHVGAADVGPYTLCRATPPPCPSTKCTAA